MPTMVQRAFVVALLGQVGWTLAYDNGVARTPPMGWNCTCPCARCRRRSCPLIHHSPFTPRLLTPPNAAWNHFHSGVSAEVLATTTDTFVNAGLRDAG